MEIRSAASKPVGMLNVKVVKCSGFKKKKDSFAKFDPYVKLHLGGGSKFAKKTRVMKGNQNPEWNESFKLVVNDPQSQSLELHVYDWEKVGAHKRMGMQVFPLKDLVSEETKSVTLDLLKTMDPNDLGNQKQRGNLTVELNYKPFKEDDLADINERDLLKTMDPNDLGNQEQRGNLPVELNYKPFKEDDLADINERDKDEEVEGTQEGIPAGGGLLVVIIHEAENVEGKHHNNPFVRIVFKGEKKKTKSVEGKTNPRWRHRPFEWVLDEPPTNDRLRVEVMSKGQNFPFKESLGYVDINLADVVKNKRINDRYKLIYSKNGKVQVELEWWAS